MFDRLTASALHLRPKGRSFPRGMDKTQGATIDRMLLSASDLWDPGHLYVALSRVKSPDGIFLQDWNEKSIIADDDVLKFYRNL
jgi:ATP-dependent DNA helicase PIF1